MAGHKLFLHHRFEVIRGLVESLQKCGLSSFQDPLPQRFELIRFRLVKNLILSFGLVFSILLMSAAFCPWAVAQTPIESKSDETKSDDPKDSNESPILAASDNRVSKYLEEQNASILQRHRPFYFAYGTPLSKLQLSFKTPLLMDSGLYFAYTQSMFWSLREESKPFEDLTFNPEIFYRWHQSDSGLESIDFAPISHVSNGKSGLDSRSMNLSYVRFNFSAEGRRWLTRLGLEVSGIFDTEKNNSDVYDFIGPFKIHLGFVQMFDAYYFDKSEFGLDLIPGGKWGTDWHRGGYQATWSFRLGAIKVVPAFYVQYYTGYGETLLYYNKKTDAFRVGFIF